LIRTFGQKLNDNYQSIAEMSDKDLPRSINILHVHVEDKFLSNRMLGDVQKINLKMMMSNLSHTKLK